MVDVIKWPPVGLTAFEISKIDPVSNSKSLFNSTPYTSSFGRSRRVATSVVSGFGYDAAQAGYMEMLKEYLLGGVNLIRQDVHSSVWHHAWASANPDISNSEISWTEDGSPLEWDVTWYERDLQGSPTVDDRGFPAIVVTGLPPNRIVVRPHEVVSVVGGSSSRAVKVVRSDASGTATIRLKSAIAESGLVILGDVESVVFKVNSTALPRSIQPQAGDWTYEWPLLEVFEDEYTSWNEVDPWS